MTKEEFDTLSKTVDPYIKVSDLKDQSDRTLVYGYDSDRNTMHLYIKDGKFFLLWYDSNNRFYKEHCLIDEDKIYYSFAYPDKRYYPESCDFEFMKLLLDRGCTPSPLPYSEIRYRSLIGLRFHGNIYYGEFKEYKL